MNHDQCIVFGVNEDGDLFWSKLTEAGMESGQYAPDDMWKDWTSVNVEGAISILYNELGLPGVGGIVD